MKRLIAMALAIAACGGIGAATISSAPEAPPVAALPSDALSQMEIAFIGTPRQSEIRGSLDAVLGLYGLDPTEENYRRAGDVLVSVRIGAQERGCDTCTEMAILEQMLQDGKLPGVDFPEAVAWASSVLAVE